MAVIKRRKTFKNPDGPIGHLTDADRYDILRRYRLGEAVSNIAEHYKIDPDTLTTFLSEDIKGLSTVQETNKLINKSQGLICMPINPVSSMNQKFLDLVPTQAEVYAFYYGMTGSNEYALKESGLDIGLPKGLTVSTKNHTLSVRGKYLRSIPSVSRDIERIRDQKIKDSDVSKPLVQSELLEQIEQLKILAADDPKYRTNLLRAIELLGKTVPDVFSDKIQIEDVSAKNGLEILMKRVKEKEEITYEPEGI